jgi:hypothetical protein
MYHRASCGHLRCEDSRDGGGPVRHVATPPGARPFGRVTFSITPRQRRKWGCNGHSTTRRGNFEPAGGGCVSRQWVAVYLNLRCVTQRMRRVPFHHQAINAAPCHHVTSTFPGNAMATAVRTPARARRGSESPPTGQLDLTSIERAGAGPGDPHTSTAHHQLTPGSVYQAANRFNVGLPVAGSILSGTQAAAQADRPRAAMPTARSATGAKRPQIRASAPAPIAVADRY